MAEQGEVPGRAGNVEALSALARDLKRAGSVTLRRQLYSGLQRAGTSTIEAVKASAGTSLPKSGGRGKRRSRMVDTGDTITNTVSGRTHKVRVRRYSRGELVSGERDSVAARVQRARFAVRPTGRGGSIVGVRLQASEGRGGRIDLNRLDDGELRHKVFGRWRAGVPTQQVPAGWFSKPVEARLDAFRKGVDEAVQEIERTISGG